MEIRICDSVKQPGWLEMRTALWPDSNEHIHLSEMESQLGYPTRFLNLIAYDHDHLPVGFAEASIRHDYVNGTNSSPVVYLEGIYTKPAARRLGVASQLVEQVIQWGQDLGCTELASDTNLGNSISEKFHKSIGFQETERVIYFRKDIRRG